MKTEAGSTFSIAELKAAVKEHKPAILFLVQGESSTGTGGLQGDRRAGEAVLLALFAISRMVVIVITTLFKVCLAEVP